MTWTTPYLVFEWRDKSPDKSHIRKRASGLGFCEACPHYHPNSASGVSVAGPTWLLKSIATSRLHADPLDVSLLVKVSDVS